MVLGLGFRVLELSELLLLSMDFEDCMTQTESSATILDLRVYTIMYDHAGLCASTLLRS